MSLTASYVILFIVLVRLPLKKAPKVISYVLWSVAAFRLLCPFSFESILSLVPMNTSPIPQDITYQQTPQINSGITAVDTYVNSSLPAPIAEASANPLQIYTHIGMYIWLLGIATMLIYSVVSVLILKSRLKSARYTEGNIYEADNLKTPFVLGIFRPRMFIPAGLSTEEKSYIVRHEQTHIRRFDHIIKPFAFLVLSIHWFNPLAWIAFVLMGTDMELSCDERVIKEMGGAIKKAYSASLLSLATGKRILNGSPLAFGEGNVGGRIKNVLNYRKPTFWMIAVAVVAVIAVGIGLLANPVDDEPDLSFLNPGNLLSLISEQKQIKVTSAEYGETYVSGPELAGWLDNAENGWSKKLITPSVEPETTIAIYIEDAVDHSICFFASDPSLALVVFGNEKRYYSIPQEDYEVMEEAAALGSTHIQSIALREYKDGKAAASVTVTDTDAINRISVVVLKGDKENRYVAANDIPPVSDYIRIDFRHFGYSQMITYYVYSQDGKSYIEKPYNRINKIDSSTMRAITAILSGGDNGTQSGPTFISTETDLIRLGTIAFNAHMTTLMSDNTPDSDRIASYKLNGISVLSGDINEFCVSLNYDFTTDNDSYVNPARGAKGKGTWPDNYLEIRIRHIEENKFEIISTGTGGGGQGLTPYAAQQSEDTTSNSAGGEIVDSVSADLIASHSDIAVTNEWISKDFGYTVLFGSLKDDPQQGVAVVIPTGDQVDKREERVLTPERHGAIKADSPGAKSSILDVVAEDGYKWIFNVYNGFDQKK
jgi:beta-lactamase regulating signal transducer with metallopeptidase domain